MHTPSLSRAVLCVEMFIYMIESLVLLCVEFLRVYVREGRLFYVDFNCVRAVAIAHWT